MAHFYAEIQGDRGEATRKGTKKSGLYSYTRGWDVGAKVVMSHDDERHEDYAALYATKGSNGSDNIYLGHLQRSGDRIVFIPTINLLGAVDLKILARRFSGNREALDEFNRHLLVELQS